MRVQGIAERRWSRALLGIVPGAIGALIILVTRLDFLPDEVEGGAWIVVAVVVTAGLRAI